MNSLILCTATRFLLPLLLMFSVFLMLRGHNEPGGGFSGGLVAASAFALYAIAYGVPKTREALRVDPRDFIGVGLIIALLSGVPSLLMNQPYLTGLWFYLPGTKIKIGTPVFFDIGVYLVVLGITLTIILALAEAEEQVAHGSAKADQ